MKTIIIHRKSSQQFLDRYRVLFQPFLESGQISFCFWDENANDFSSALPELPDQLRGCMEWRAIVAMPVEESADDGASDQFLCRDDNPFDYLQNADPEPPEEESPIPLIRLSQMLGGVPIVTPRVGSGSNVRKDPEWSSGILPPHVLDTDEALAARWEKWQELTDRYSTNCVLPTSLYLFKGYVPSEIELPDATDREAAERTESDSSLFWYRNRYPAKARFLTGRFSRPGNAHYPIDLFTYWITVLTLAINAFPTGTFEAYKLYETEAVVSTQQLHKYLSRYYDRLDHILYAANQKIIDLKRDAQFVREQDELPQYQTTVSVLYRHMDDKDLMIRDPGLGLASDCPAEEGPWWSGQTRLSRRALNRLISSVRPVLDRACSFCKSISVLTDGELVEMDEYQFAEMEEELSALETEILTFRDHEVLTPKEIHRMIDQRSKEGSTRIKKHITRRRAIAIGCVGMGGYLLCFLPELIRRLRDSGEYEPLIFAAAGTLILGAATLIALYRFRKSVRVKLGNYNGTMKGILESIMRSASLFSQYLSNCASYMRGRSMLQKLAERVMISNSAIRQMTDHADTLRRYMQMVSSWLGDFHLLPQKKAFHEKNIDFDFDIPPVRNRGYQLQTEDDDPTVPMAGGSECTAPYPFVAEFRAARRSVFEPNRRQEKGTESARETGDPENA